MCLNKGANHIPRSQYLYIQPTNDTDWKLSDAAPSAEGVEPEQCSVDIAGLRRRGVNPFQRALRLSCSCCTGFTRGHHSQSSVLS